MTAHHMSSSNNSSVMNNIHTELEKHITHLSSKLLIIHQ